MKTSTLSIKKVNTSEPKQQKSSE